MTLTLLVWGSFKTSYALPICKASLVEFADIGRATYLSEPFLKFFFLFLGSVRMAVGVRLKRTLLIGLSYYRNVARSY